MQTIIPRIVKVVNAIDTLPDKINGDDRHFTLAVAIWTLEVTHSWVAMVSSVIAVPIILRVRYLERHRRK